MMSSPVKLAEVFQTLLLIHICEKCMVGWLNLRQEYALQKIVNDLNKKIEEHDNLMAIETINFKVNLI